MKNCKLAMEKGSDCGKTVCCAFCEEFDGCPDSCCDSHSDEVKCEHLVEGTTELTFTQKHLSVFQNLKMFKTQKEEMEKEEAELKAVLLKAMDEAGIKSIDNEYIKITHVAAGKTSVSIDLKELKKKEPKLYDELLADYPKHSAGKAAYVRFTVK